MYQLSNQGTSMYQAAWVGGEQNKNRGKIVAGGERRLNSFNNGKGNQGKWLSVAIEEAEGG